MAKADLIAKAQDMGMTLTGKETVADLEEMLRPIAIPEQPPVDNDHVAEGAEQFTQPETTPEAVDNTTLTPVPPVEEPTKTAPSKTIFEVYGPDGGYIRAYTQIIHGDDAEKLANEFVASHPGYTIQ